MASMLPVLPVYHSILSKYVKSSGIGYNKNRMEDIEGSNNSQPLESATATDTVPLSLLLVSL